MTSGRFSEPRLLNWKRHVRACLSIASAPNFLFGVATLPPMHRLRRGLVSRIVLINPPRSATRLPMRQFHPGAPRRMTSDTGPAEMSTRQPSSKKAAEETPRPAKRSRYERKQDQMHPATLSLLRQYLGLEDKTNSVFNSATPLDPVFIAIDVEAFEYATQKVTEVGIAVLDTRELPAFPNASASEWAEKIRTHHHIIQEHRHLRNKRFVKGCPENFMFGESNVTPLIKMRDILKLAFTPADPSAGENCLRNVVLVGHDVRGDLNWIAKLGYSIRTTNPPIGLVDSQKIAKALKLPEGLATLVNALGEHPEFLHNAGNDAYWTMQSVLLLALYGSVLPEPPSMENARQIREKQIQAAKEKSDRLNAEAKRVREEKEAKEKEAKEALDRQGEGLHDVSTKDLPKVKAAQPRQVKGRKSEEAKKPRSVPGEGAEPSSSGTKKTRRRSRKAKISTKDLNYTGSH